MTHITVAEQKAAIAKRERMLREAGETALTLIEDRGRANAHAWASHCAVRDPHGGFWRQVVLAIEEAP
jgi:hypothetical protein